MTILKLAPSLGIGALGLSGGAVAGLGEAPENIAQAVPFLEAVIWTTTIEGQVVQVTGQGLLAIISVCIGVIGLLISIIKLFRE